MLSQLYPIFRHWSKTGSVYIMSDTHFDDSDCNYMDPFWVAPERQIEILKSYCKKSDTLILLGDIGNAEWLSKLKCYKVLVMGNHDSGKTNYERKIIHKKYDVEEYTKEDIYEINRSYTDAGYSISISKESGEFRAPFVYYYVTLDNHLFDEIYEGPLFIGEKILLSHEAVPNVDFALNIHGHDHGGIMNPNKLELNVAANVCNYKPVNLKDIIKSGAIKNIESLHRQTISRASLNKNIKK